VCEKGSLLLRVDADRALDFLDFVRARHTAWEARQGMEFDLDGWAFDPIVATRKFTNVFRLLDPGSQFVITDLGGCDMDVFLMRCFLYRHTNLPSAWRAYAAETGEMPWGPHCLEDLRTFWHSHPKVFSGAYMIYPQSSVPGTNKVDSVIDLTKRLFFEDKLFDQFAAQDNQRERFAVLRANKGVADFMSMQILTDFGYSTEFREDEFVVPGPGARKGAASLSSGPAEQVVEWAYQAIRQMPNPPSVAGRLPSRMDAQNCLCEFSKWVRYKQRPVPTKLYQPAHPGPQPKPVLPVHW
jgi:hypothetical protein